MTPQPFNTLLSIPNEQLSLEGCRAKLEVLERQLEQLKQEDADRQIEHRAQTEELKRSVFALQRTALDRKNLLIKLSDILRDERYLYS